MNYLSVCSGIEAATVAWHPLGWTPFGFAEIEAFPCAVLAHHYGSNYAEAEYPKNGVPNFGNMEAYRTWPDANIDVLVGGTPCQSFSVAGLRKGLSDPRGNLALTFLGIADRYRPEWVIWENVPGVLSQDDGRAFGSIIGGLAELGYGWAYRVLDAQYVRVDGLGRAVPQRRRRVFVVGCAGGWRRAGAVLFEPESLSGNPAPRRKAGEGIAGRVAFGIDSDCLDRSGEGRDQSAGARSGLGIQPELSSALRSKRPNAVAFGGNNASGPVDVAAALAAHPWPAGRLNFASETFVAGPVAFDSKSSGRSGFGVGEIAPTLRSMNSTPASHPNAGGQIAVAYDLRNGTEDDGGNPNAVPHTMQGWAVRRLTPLECERLQGFPDGYTAVPFRGKFLAADGPRYKALGNSMAVNCMRWLGRRIQIVSREN